MDVVTICEAFDLGAPTGPLSYVARGELGRVSRLTTAAGVWAVKEIELFVPTVEEADANVDLQELMLDAGVSVPRPRRTVDGHGLFENVRVYQWLDLAPLPDQRPARVCHLDVCPENVFLDEDRVTIIDWENAGPAATKQDLGSTLWDFGQGDIASTRAFVEHYRGESGPIERLESSVFDTARVVQANLVDFHCRLTLDRAAPAETRRRAERGLRAILTRPLTRRRIDDVVAG